MRLPSGPCMSPTRVWLYAGTPNIWCREAKGRVDRDQKIPVFGWGVHGVCVCVREMGGSDSVITGASRSFLGRMTKGEAKLAEYGMVWCEGQKEETGC